MEPQEEQETITFPKRIMIVFLFYLAVALIFLWVSSFLPAFSRQRARMRELKPLMAEAKKLGLTYEMVLENPVQAAGKPAVWCIQNRGPDEIRYKGLENSRISVVGDKEMPGFYGGMHTACSDMLVIITGVRKTNRISDVTVRFVEELH